LDVVGVEEVIWDEGGIELAGIYTFIYAIYANHHLGTGFFIHTGISTCEVRVC